MFGHARLPITFPYRYKDGANQGKSWLAPPPKCACPTRSARVGTKPPGGRMPASIRPRLPGSSGTIPAWIRGGLGRGRRRNVPRQIEPLRSGGSNPVRSAQPPLKAGLDPLPRCPEALDDCRHGFTDGRDRASVEAMLEATRRIPRRRRGSRGCRRTVNERASVAQGSMAAPPPRKLLRGARAGSQPLPPERCAGAWPPPGYGSAVTTA